MVAIRGLSIALVVFFSIGSNASPIFERLFGTPQPKNPPEYRIKNPLIQVFTDGREPFLHFAIRDAANKGPGNVASCGGQVTPERVGKPVSVTCL